MMVAMVTITAIGCNLNFHGVIVFSFYTDALNQT